MKVGIQNVFLIVAFLMFAGFDLVAKGEWSSSTVQVTGGNCLVRETRVDETKLTFIFDDFAARSNSGSILPVRVVESCEASVVFRLPPYQKLKTLSHRVIAFAEKVQSSEISLLGSVEILGENFKSNGRLPSGSIFSGRVLLYRSFDLGALAQCQPHDQQVTVKASWLLQILADEGEDSSHIDLTGAEQRVDLWVDTEPC